MKAAELVVGRLPTRLQLFSERAFRPVGAVLRLGGVPDGNRPTGRRRDGGQAVLCRRTGVIGGRPRLNIAA